MASLDLTSFASALKEHYTDERVQNMVYKDNPLLAMMPKYEQFGGKNLPIPIIYGNPQGRSATFSTAQANKTASQITDFVLTRNRDYSLASIDNETLEASKGNANAFMEAATTEIDGAINSITRSLAIAQYRSGSGSIGQANAATTTTALQLKEAADVTNFEVGMELVASTADGGGSVKSGSVTVTAVDRDSGAVTIDAASAIDGGSGIALDDFLFVEGDYDSKVKGLQAWLPDAAPTAGDNFFSVDRSTDATRLGGIRYDGSSQPIEEAIIGAIHRVAREGGRPSHLFMSYEKWDELAKSLGSKVQYIDEAVKIGNAHLNFRGIMVHGPKGPVKVLPDQNCPNGRAFLLQLDMWKCYSLGKAPQILDTDGLKMLRESSADAVEVRVGYYAQVGCRAPGYNANVKLD
jgi:hypothetical protein